VRRKTVQIIVPTRASVILLQVNANAFLVSLAPRVRLVLVLRTVITTASATLRVDSACAKRVTRALLARKRFAPSTVLVMENVTSNLACANAPHHGKATHVIRRLVLKNVMETERA